MPCSLRATAATCQRVPNFPRARSLPRARRLTCHCVPAVLHATRCRFDLQMVQQGLQRVRACHVPARASEDACQFFHVPGRAKHCTCQVVCVPCRAISQRARVDCILIFATCRAVPEILRAKQLPVRAMPKIVGASLVRAVPCQSLAVPECFVPCRNIILPCLRVRAVPEPP